MISELATLESLSLDDQSAGQLRSLNAEIANGRLAMLGILGMFGMLGILGMVCLGKDNKKLHDVFENLVDQIDDALSADEAVEKATSMAKEGYTVLLSPACASFDLFNNYEDRGQKFKKGILKLNQ